MIDSMIITDNKLKYSQVSLESRISSLEESIQDLAKKIDQQAEINEETTEFIMRIQSDLDTIKYKVRGGLQGE